MTPSDPSLKQILSPQQIQDRVKELAAELSADLKDKNAVLLGVLNGAFIFMGDLARHITVPVKLDFVRLASYGSGSESSGQITMTKGCELPLRDASVVVVEDIVDTGLTIQWLVEQLRDMGAADVKVCALIDKPERREIDLSLDYVGFVVPKGFLVGYGLDYDENYRCLPGVCEVEL